MPVTGATTRNDYVASLGQTVFPYTFQILLASDIKVIKSGTVLTLDNDYTVSNVGVAGGGNVTLLSAASPGDTVSVFLAMPIDRTTEYQNAGDFLASDVNGDFDKGYVAMNQLQTDIARSIHLKDRDPSVDMTLPIAGDRANKFLRFNAQGLPEVSTGTPINEDIITPAQFGALGDGSDDDAAIQAMVAYVKANGGGTIDLEDKVYNVGSTIAFGVPITLLCGTGGGFRARNTSNYTEITGRSGEVQTNPDGGNYTVLFDIDGMAYSSFQGRFILTSVGPTTIMGGEVKYIPNLIAIAQQDGTGPVQALNGYFESLYVTNLHAAFFQPEKAEGFGPVLPYTRTYFARLEIIRCYQAWNFLHVNGFDDCAVGVMRINKCARDAYAKAFDLDCLEAFLAGGKAIATGTFSTTATSTAFTVSADADVVVGDAVMIKGAETYGQGFTTKIATLVGTSGTFEDVCPVTVSDAQFIFASGGYEMDRATFVCAKLYLEGSHYKLLNFTRQATLDCQTLKFSTGEFSCYQGRPITFEHINSLCNIGSVPQSEQGVNGNVLIDGSLGKLIQSYVYIGLREFIDIQIPPPNPDTGLPLPTPENTFNFYPDHNCTIKLMMTKADMEAYGINPIEVGHTIYDPAGKAGGIREYSTSDSQLFVEYSDQTVKVSGDIGGTPTVINPDNSEISLTSFGGSPSSTAAQNTTAILAAWNALKGIGGKIILDKAGTYNFNNSVFGRTTKPIEIEAVDGVLLYPGNPQATTWMWDFQSDTGVTQVSFTNVRVSGQKADNTREEFLGIRVGPSNNLTAYKCFGRYVNGTAWQFLRPHNSEIDMTTFFCGKDGDTDANRFAMMITGVLDVPNGQDDVFNDVRLSGTSEKDYYGWVVEGGTILRTTSQLKMHGSAYSKRAFQLHRVAEFDVEITATQRYNKNGFVHFSDAGNGGGITLFQNCTGASLPIRGTAALSNATNLQVYTGDVSGYPTAAPASAIDAYVFDMASQFSGVKCTGLLSPQAAVDVTAGNFVNGIQYRISDLGSAGNAAWVTYTGVSATYKVGDFFTGTSNDSSLLTGAVVTRRYAMVGLAAPGDEFARPYLGELGQTTQVFDQFLRDERTDSDRELIQEFLPSIDAAKIEQFGSQTPRFRITRLFGQRTANPPAAFDRRGSVSGSNNDIISLERGGLKTGGIGVEASADSSQEVTFIDSSYELAETVNAGDFVTGQRYSISNLGSAGNAAWVTFLGARPGGGDYVTGDLFVAPGNGSALTGAQAQIYHLGAGLSFDKTAVLPRQDQARADKVVSLGSADHAFNELFLGDIKILSGTGDPSAGSGTAAPQGSMFLRTDGGASTTLYVKTGGGNTDWTAK